MTAAAVYLAVSLYYSNRFFPGSYINGADCSGMTVEEVEKQIADSVTDYSLTVLERGENEEVIEGSAINFSYVSTGTVEELQKQQNSFNWMYAFFHPEDHSMVAETSYDQDFLKTAMEKLDCFDETNVTDPQNAYIREDGLNYELVPEVEGNRLDPEKALATLISAVNQGARSVSFEENDCYVKPAVTSKNENLVKRYEILTKYAGMSVTYSFGEERKELDAATIKSWMTVSETGEVTFNDQSISDYVAGLAEEYDTYQKDVQFTTSLGETVTINSCDYGWQLDQETEKVKLKEYLEKGDPVVREPVWLKTAWARTKNGIGSTYVEVDYTNQHMWYYKGGTLLADTPVVTGNTSKDMASPVGIFALYGKEPNAILKGEGYKTRVDYWMPFYGGVGIHDAKWRGQFGGTIYQTNGSHGCINTPWGQAGIIYENIDGGTPVICYNAPTNLGQGAVSVSQPPANPPVDDEEDQQNSSGENSGSADGTVTWDENTGTYQSAGDNGVVVIE